MNLSPIPSNSSYSQVHRSSTRDTTSLPFTLLTPDSMGLFNGALRNAMAMYSSNKHRRDPSRLDISEFATQLGHISANQILNEAILGVTLSHDIYRNNKNETHFFNFGGSNSGRKFLGYLTQWSQNLTNAFLRILRSLNIYTL